MPPIGSPVGRSRRVPLGEEDEMSDDENSDVTVKRARSEAAESSSSTAAADQPAADQPEILAGDSMLDGLDIRPSRRLPPACEACHATYTKRGPVDVAAWDWMTRTASPPYRYTE